MFKEADVLTAAVVEKKLKEKSLSLPRIDSIDLLRGIVMVLMALDHVRFYFTDVRYDPLDLSQTDFFLFMTRWITHYCAPVFVFLAGTGAFLSSTRGKTKPEISWFLFTRGLWLVFLELTVIRFGWLFNFDYSFSFVQVIWAIGWSMVALSLLVYLPVRAVAAFGIIMILFHNLFDGITPAETGNFGWLWHILHFVGTINYSSGNNLFVLYPLIPWIGVMAAGYGFGKIMLIEESRRNKILLSLGLSLISAFLLLRGLEIYGDANLWTEQKSFLFTILDFIDTTKYPPSLLFLCMTLGPAITLLPMLAKIKGSLNKFFLTFGRVPLFYYILHIPFIHLLALLTALIMGINSSFMFNNSMPNLWPAEWGFGLPVVYLVWLVVVIALYPVSLWFADVKKKKKNRWLSYL